MLPKRLLQPSILRLVLGLAWWWLDSAGICVAEPVSWRHLETTYTVVYYRSSEDLVRLSEVIGYRPKVWKTGNGSPSSEAAAPGSAIAAKLDALYERVQEILDMRRRIEKTNIRIYPNQSELHRTYRGLYRESCHVRAWYSFETNTVFLNVDDLKEGIVAHELAHSIIDHYLLIRPPAATAEILARYVDAHLRD